ncbi:DsbA family oxidoreductase [Novispirillum itersonii]|uniref:DsbA family oxidoreductase n=1 Tax=Novispirillum itersonii TaxID=189 RepID=UPI00035EE89D|nr:DsbA family oxidoreductase [Novispirillum itersonii]
MRIEVIFDTVCPWCFIGKRRLEKALALRPSVSADLVWRPFLLNPDAPAEGISRQVYLDRKFGGPTRVDRMLSTLRDIGVSEGIDFDFNAISITPNTVDSHRLVSFAASYGKASAMVERLFRAYFIEGKNIGDTAVLRRIADEQGLPGEDFFSDRPDAEYREDVLTENSQTHRMSINGVPCFIFNGAYGIAGAQDTDVLLRMIDLALENAPLTPLSSPAAE